MSTPSLEVSDLVVRFASLRGSVNAVNGVSLAVEPGQVHGIVGESGSGKTTVLRSILGLLPKTAAATGTIAVGGERVLLNPRRYTTVPGVSIVFQEPMTALNPVVAIGSQIAEAPRFALGLGRAAARGRALELMAQVGIPDRERRYASFPHELSGGLRQRVLIAIALSSDPKVMLCDEPTTALDVTIQDQILKLFREISDQTGVAIVYVTHDLAVVAQVCQTLSVMYAGRFVESGLVSEVFAQPRHPYTLGLIGALPGRHKGRALTAIPGSPPDMVELPQGCPFYPRCSFAQSDCEVTEVSLLSLNGRQHETACIHHDELAVSPRNVGGQT